MTQSVTGSATARTKALAIVLLLAHGAVLAWSAYRYSPTLDEPAHLAAGVYYWQTGRFDLYEVNPPLTRLVASLPLVALGAETEFHGRTIFEREGMRREFAIGFDFQLANIARWRRMMMFARWTCIPFSLLGAVVCGLWARDLYGPRAGLLALFLWCVCPNMLGHGALATPDVAASALGVSAGYCFWRWLRGPRWLNAIGMGIVFGLAALTKTTLLILFPLGCLIWFAAAIRNRNSKQSVTAAIQAGMLVLAAAMSLYVVHLGYGFQGSLRSIDELEFHSRAFTGEVLARDQVRPARIAHTVWGGLPWPLPADYVRGIDLQCRDFESPGMPSYLRGQWRDRGWWYYYLYAAGVKVPLGTWAILLAATGLRLLRPRWRELGPRHDVVLTIYAAAIFTIVSSQTGFNHHFRYVLPALPFLFVWSSQLVEEVRNASHGWKAFVVIAVAWNLASSGACVPHSLSYFNELVGGPKHGAEHLLHSNVDWGQDLYELDSWRRRHLPDQQMFVAYDGILDPRLIGMRLQTPPAATSYSPKPTLPPGWYAVSVNLIYGRPGLIPHETQGRLQVPAGAFTYFQELEPAARAGYSILIYRVHERE